MAFTDIAPPPEPKGSGSTGISLGLRVTKSRGVLARLTISEEQQNLLFGGPVNGKRFHMMIGRGQDEGIMKLCLTSDGDIEAKTSAKGAVFLTMKGWDLLPKDGRPAAQCTVKSHPSNVELYLCLPSWCRPNGVGGKMEAEFGISKQKIKK